MLLPLTDPLMATFSETRAPSSRKYIAEQGVLIPNLSETLQSSWLYSSTSALEKFSKTLNFNFN